MHNYCKFKISLRVRVISLLKCRRHENTKNKFFAIERIADELLEFKLVLTSNNSILHFTNLIIFIHLASPQGQGHNNSICQLLWIPVNFLCGGEPEYPEKNCTTFGGILRNPDRTRTRTGRKPGLDKNPDPTLGLTFRKNRTGFYKTQTR